MTLAKKNNRKQAEFAYFALRDLFSKTLLKDGQKLTAFQYHPLVKDKIQEEIPNFDIVEAYYDHCIKETYRDFVTNVLVELSKDDLEYFRKLALDILVDLIQAKPEIEDLILSIVINKLGDNSKKVQLHAISVLCKLVKNHHKMASTIVHEVNVMLQRPGITVVQRYYSTAFLNKVALIGGSHDEKLRLSLFKVYFYMFRSILQKPEEKKSDALDKKDRSISKRDRIEKNKKTLKKLKQIKQNGDIDEEENKIVE